MTGRIEARLKELDITVPEAPAPVASYVGALISGKQIFVSGQIPLSAGKLTTGTVGKELSVEEGQAAAKLCAINVLAQVKAVCDLDAIAHCVRLGVFVNSVPGFTDAPEVANGASDLMVAVFGDAGKHTRSAVGAAALPRNVAVEVEATFEMK